MWLLSLQLRLTVAEAVGSMSHLMAHDKLEEQLPKLLPAILGLYKKNAEHYIISKVESLTVPYEKCLFITNYIICITNEKFPDWAKLKKQYGCVFVQSLCQILEASVNMGSRVLETQIDGLLLALHQQVCLSLFLYLFSTCEYSLYASIFSARG